MRIYINNIKATLDDIKALLMNVSIKDDYIKSITVRDKVLYITTL